MENETPTPNQPDLITLTSVDPHSVWPDEAGDFTPWLRDHIELLGAELGIRFDSVNTEEPVGRYNADLWGQEEGPQGRGIVIENQLTDSNHDHLGKLLTYGSWLKADLLVWVAPRFRDEHLDAIGWLNENSREGRSYFAVQIEVLKVDDSRFAPRFRILVQPKGWNPGPPKTAPSPRRLAYNRFFTELLARIKAEIPGLTQMSQVRYDSYLGMPSGRTGFVYSIAFTRDQGFRVELYIDQGKGKREENKAAFGALEDSQEAIESELGSKLSWEQLEDARASRIASYTSGSIDYSEEAVEQLRSWAITTLTKFREIFGNRIKDLCTPTNNQTRQPLKSDSLQEGTFVCRLSSVSNLLSSPSVATPNAPHHSRRSWGSIPSTRLKTSSRDRGSVTSSSSFASAQTSSGSRSSTASVATTRVPAAPPACGSRCSPSGASAPRTVTGPAAV